MSAADEQILYTGRHAARVLGMSYGTFRRHAQPYLAYVPVGTRPLKFYSRAELERWRKRNEIKPWAGDRDAAA